MGTPRPASHARALTPAGIVVAMLAALLSLGTQAPAGAADLNTVTAHLRLSTGADAEGYVEVWQKDPAPATTYSHYTDNYAPGGSVDVDLPPGTYKFDFTSVVTGAEKWYATGGATGADIDDATPVVLNANTDLGVITFDVRTITAVVKDQNGNPAPGVQVRIAADPDDLGNDPGDYWGSQTTDSQGRVVFRDQPTADAPYLQAYDGNAYEDPGYVPTYDPSDVQQVSAGTAGASVNLTMQKLASVSGYVVKPGGAGLGLITVKVLDPSGEQVGTTGTSLSTGAYTVTGIPAGTYTLEFSDQLGDYETQYLVNQTSFADAQFAHVNAYQQFNAQAVMMTPATKPTPTGVDLAGVVSGRGKPLGNVEVSAYRNGVWKDSVITGRDGSYAFTNLTSGSYKVSYDRLSGPADELPFAGQWYQGAHSIGGATPVTVTQDVAGAGRNVTLDSYGVITGTVEDSAGNAIDDSYVEADDVDGNWVDGTGGAEGSYQLVVPPGTYRVRFDGWDDSDWTSFISEWWDNSPTIEGAKPITVAPGATVTASAWLTKNLETTVAPQISGSTLVGGTLTASTGTWNLMADNDYQYAWYRGTTQVGTGPTYQTTAADAGASLTVRVTASHQWLTGTSLSAPSGVVKYRSASSLSGTSRKKGVVRLTIAVTGAPGPGGTVTIKRGGAKIVKTGVAVINGVATVKLTRQPSGKRTYVAMYSGTTKVLPSISNRKTITVK